MVQRRSYRDPVKEAYWRGVFVDWRASGLSRRSFCERRQLKLTTLDFWRQEIARRDAEEKSDSKQASPKSTSTKASATIERDKSHQPLLVPVRVVSGATLVVVLVNGRVIRVPDGVDPNQLRGVGRRGGSSVLTLDLPTNIYLCLVPTDVRKSFDTLAVIGRRWDCFDRRLG